MYPVTWGVVVMSWGLTIFFLIAFIISHHYLKDHMTWEAFDQCLGTVIAIPIGFIIIAYCLEGR